MFNINKLIKIVNKNSWPKSLIITFGYLAFSIITLKLKVLSILFIIYHYLVMAYFLQISYIYFVNGVITEQLHKLLYTIKINKTTLLDYWQSIKYFYEKTFSEVLIMNRFLDFVTITVFTFKLCCMSNGHIFNYMFLYDFCCIIIPYSGKTILLVKSVNEVIEKVIYFLQ